MKVSIIVCYTNKKMYEDMSVYIKNQDIANEIEQIGIDNTSNTYTSAAAALNYGASISTGEVLVWMHQDILLYPNNAISTVYEFLTNCDKVSLVGVAGVKSGENKVLSAIYEGIDRKEKYIDTLIEPTQVVTVDECLLAMKKADWEQNKFDEKTCNDWHLYGVDMAYSIQLKGGDVICLPIKLCHLSGGKLNKSFYKTLINLTKKYKNNRKEIARIETTCVNIKNSIFVARYRLSRHTIAAFLKNKN